MTCRSQAITWTNDELLSIRPLETNFSEIWIRIQNISFRKMDLKCCLWNGGHFVQREISLHSKVPWDITHWRSCQPFWVMSTGQQKVARNHLYQEKHAENLVGTVPADGLAPFGRHNANQSEASYIYMNETDTWRVKHRQAYHPYMFIFNEYLT